ncbi:MAG: C69 family dipeptidase [Bacteroidales bacterium]|nr:C69 family dipeptidase [Bacteroidales bacterium]MDD7724062.1 C69 family dipeptidase [Bacteroidales bacterium]
MKAKLFLAVFLTSAAEAMGCTNFIVTPGASADGSTICTYNADDYGMFGDLCFYPAARHGRGHLRDIVSWDTHVWTGAIPEAEETYSVIGNINEFQVTIGETTYGGRNEMIDTTGMLDYGTLIYLALQRSKTAREAISVMTTLAETYGYNSSGETFSICDPREAWIMEMMGRGPGSKGVVWVALRVPDGMICAHANQSRIGNYSKLGLPKEDVLTSKHVISYARQMGWFKGKDSEFSWKEVYAHPDMEGRRFCDARVWSFFSHHADMKAYEPWALGRDENAQDMPLWIRPDKKLSVHDVMMDMRDHYEGTQLSLADTSSLAGGVWQMPYRATPLVFKGDDGKEYFWERPTSTQQTAFTFVSQMRANLPNHIGGVLWFGNDDANMIAYTPIYCSSTRRPTCFATPGADATTFSYANAFWVCNWVSNMVYPRYSALFPDLEAARDALEADFLSRQAEIEAEAAKMQPEEAKRFLNDYTIAAADKMMSTWHELATLLIVKHNDMALRRQNPDGTFKKGRVSRPGYPAAVRRLLINKGEVEAL